MLIDVFNKLKNIENTILNDKYKGFVSIILANIIFGLNIPITSSLMVQWMTPLGYTIIQMLFGTIVFWVISLFSQKVKIDRKDKLTIIIGGLLGFVITEFLFSQSLKLTTPVVFSLLITLVPITTFLLSEMD